MLNHTSDQHPWFQEARRDRTSPQRDYYVWSDTTDRYQDARIIFKDTEHSNWTWDAVAQQYYWHRFYSHQPDLNFDNPAVRQEILDVIAYWLDRGIDGFRVDAVPYLYEREGTSCENLPETHDFCKEMRRFVDEHYPGAVLLAEANQWPHELLPYFGDGRRIPHGVQFSADAADVHGLAPRAMLGRSSRSWTRCRRFPQACQWALFLRNHDELTLEMVIGGRSRLHVQRIRQGFANAGSTWASAAAWRRSWTTTAARSS